MSKTPADETQVKRFGDPQMEVMMGRLLQVGVLLASAVVLIGGVLYLHAQHGSIPNYRSFSSEPAKLRQLRDMGQGIATGDPATIIQLGTLRCREPDSFGGPAFQLLPLTVTCESALGEILNGQPRSDEQWQISDRNRE